MPTFFRSSCVQQPERIHPALWRATQFARACRPTVPTGYRPLNDALPGQGWPVGSLIELMPARPGIGEISLLQPALAQLGQERSIALVQPPFTPYFHCWNNWRLDGHRLLWIRSQTANDALWATEQALKHNACTAVLCWASHVPPAALRRLHLAAQQTDMLFFLLRPPSAAQQTSVAPLRLRLQPSSPGLDAHIIKRQGPSATGPISIVFYASPKPHAPSRHVSVDLPLPSHAQPGHLLSSVAN